MTILSDDWFERYLKGLINHAKEKDPMDGYITLFYEEAEDILDTIDDLRRQVGELEEQREGVINIIADACEAAVKEPEVVEEKHICGCNILRDGYCNCREEGDGQ